MQVKVLVRTSKAFCANKMFVLKNLPPKKQAKI